MCYIVRSDPIYLWNPSTNACNLSITMWFQAEINNKTGILKFFNQGCLINQINKIITILNFLIFSEVVFCTLIIFYVFEFFLIQFFRDKVLYVFFKCIKIMRIRIESSKYNISILVICYKI